ncbi:hypothetical protein NM688_g9347 [Phlebia brevispora]|uniref:Uncharacterized protein n=1 Tax=Phlebia brevispora TaxID=194682 RepID=A0ACC1RIK8_9APHY|nr:hypothetical protein NM688_g9347 [Phlebia brevispora]
MEDLTSVHRQTLASGSYLVDLAHFIQHLVPMVFGGEESRLSYERIDREVASSIQTNPGEITELLERVHRMRNDDSNKSFYIYHITTQLALSDDAIWVELRDLEPTIDDVLLDIILDGDFCGFSRGDLYRPSEPGAVPRASFVHNLALLSNLAAQKLFTLFTLLHEHRSDVLIGYVETIQRRTDAVWERISRIMLPSDYIKNDFPDVADMLQACVMWIGHGWHALRCASKYKQPAVDYNVARQCLYTFCSARKELYRNETFFLLYNMLQSGYITDDQLMEMCNEVFRGEDMSLAFVNACVATLSTPKLSVISTESLLSYQPVQALLWFQQQAIARDPRILRNVAARRENMSRLGNSGMLACQRLKCQCGGDLDAERSLKSMCALTNYLLFTFRITTHFDQRVACTGFLLGADVLEKAIRDRNLEDAKHVIRFISKCGVAAAEPPENTHGKGIRKDIVHLMHTVHGRYQPILQDLRRSGLPKDEMMKLALQGVGDILRMIERRGYAGQASPPRNVQGRCHLAGCACSGVKPPHQLRVCKGCWQVEYCSKYCLEL